jgi:hypothetical protein
MEIYSSSQNPPKTKWCGDTKRIQKKWSGQSSSTPEIVVFYDGKVWPPQSLPQGFDKSKSVVVSFEEKNIRFYDFFHNSGGYYERRTEN